MSEPLKIMLTALVAVCVFVVGQFIQRLIVEPIQEQWRTIGKIVGALTVYQNTWLFASVWRTQRDAGAASESHPELNAATVALRQLAADLRTSLYTLPLYGLWAAFGFVKKRRIVEEVANELLLWHGFTER